MRETKGASFEDLKEIDKLTNKYWRQKERKITCGSSLNIKQDGNLDELKKLCYTSSKEGKDMSLMILIYDGTNTYIGTDSRETFEDKTYNDNCKKIFTSKDKKMIISTTGLIKKAVDGEVINFAKEITELLFNGKSIYEILDTIRLNNQTYSDLIGDDSIHFFVARKGKEPILIDVAANETVVKSPRKINRVYSNGNYDTFKVNNLINTYLGEGYSCKDAIKSTIEHVITLTNKRKVSTIGGDVQIKII